MLVARVSEFQIARPSVIAGIEARTGVGQATLGQASLSRSWTQLDPAGPSSARARPKLGPSSQSDATKK